MRRISDFINPFFLIVLGITFIFFFNNPKKLSPENTNKVEGIISYFPEDGMEDDVEFIGLWIKGFSNFYIFSECSSNNEIKEKVKHLIPGDSVTLFVNKNSSSDNYLWKGSTYKAYLICDAYSKKTGQLISFNQFNDCDKQNSDYSSLVISIILIVMGIYNFYNRYKSPDNLMDTKYLSINDKEGIKKDYIIIKPDLWTYVIKRSIYPIILIGLGFFLKGTETNSLIGNIVYYLGLFRILHLIIISNKIYYIIDQEGVHIKNVSYVFQTEIEKIKFYEIKEVIVESGIFEISTGTVKIYKGIMNDGDKVYSKLISIREYRKIADFLEEQIKS